MKKFYCLEKKSPRCKRMCGNPYPYHKCWHNPDNKKSVSSAELNTQYMGNNSKLGQDRSRGQVVQHGNHYDDNNDKKYRTEHHIKKGIAW